MKKTIPVILIIILTVFCFASCQSGSSNVSETPAVSPEASADAVKEPETKTTSVPEDNPTEIPGTQPATEPVSKATDTPTQKPEKKNTYDFNGKDFDTVVYTETICDQDECVKAELLEEAVEGAEGGVYSGSGTYLICVGIAFNEDIYLQDIEEFNIRLKVAENSSHSKNPLLRLYDDKVNQMRVSVNFTDYGEFDKWCDVNIISLIEEAKLTDEGGAIQPFTFLYRCYDADTTIWLDSITIK